MSEHLILACYFTSIAIIAFIILWMLIDGSKQQILDALEALEHPSFNDPPSFLMPFAIVQCGGCGQSVKASDGFNPDPHKCDPDAK
jgi:hypothetical protein